MSRPTESPVTTVARRPSRPGKWFRWLMPWLRPEASLYAGFSEDNRKIVVTTFATFIYALAYNEAVLLTGRAMREGAFRAETLMLFGVFVLLSLEVIVARLALLTDGRHLRSGGWLWLTDAVFTLVEGLLIILLGSSIAPDANLNSAFGFVDVLILCALLNMLWIVVHTLLCRRRRYRPWRYWDRFLQETVALGVYVILARMGARAYSPGVLVWLLLHRVVDFAIDLGIDRYGLRKPGTPEATDAESGRTLAG